MRRLELSQRQLEESAHVLGTLIHQHLTGEWLDSNDERPENLARAERDFVRRMSFQVLHPEDEE